MKKNILFLLTILVALFGSNAFAQKQMEDINRGLVAVRTNANNVYVGWRLFGNDPDSVAFNIYCNDVLVNPTPVKGATNYNHTTTSDGTYYIKPVIHNIEQSQSESALVWAQNYMDIPLERPDGGTTISGGNYDYSPNDVSVGDLDGDGEYELVVKWDPSNSQDNSKSGYTGNVYLDGYEMDGTHLWRIDLGINIRAGAHYTQFMVYDLDGDGKAELACKTAPGTKDNSGGYISTGPASGDDDDADYRNSSGYILSGPEYLTLFNGETGLEISTLYYDPQRGSLSSWGDTYGNRVDRFLGAIAYLDGKHPSLVMTRGYYTSSDGKYGRSVIASFDYSEGVFSARWTFSADKKGANPTYVSQGNHNLSVADVDGDGKDEIIYGQMTIDDDGTGLYSTGLGHGDALHVSDLDPDRPGLEVFTPHEEGGNGVSFRDVKTGEILWQHKKPGVDVGRALSADIIAEYKGNECWATDGLGVYNCKGEVVSSKFPSSNFAIWWDGDELRELLDGGQPGTGASPQIDKYGTGTLFYATGCYSNNSTKKTPNLQADLFGDWREEIVYRTTDNEHLRVFTTTSTTNRRIYTLMHDPQYRVAVAWQNAAYNQPPHPSFFIGADMQDAPVAQISNGKLSWNSGINWNLNSSANWLENGSASVFNNNDKVLFDLSGDNSSSIAISGSLSPASVDVVSPTNFTFSGSGSLTGSMSLNKAGSGNLTLENQNTYTGQTYIWDGALFVNGNLSSSNVFVYKFATLGGSATINSDVILKNHAALSPGTSEGIPSTLTINGNLNAEEKSIIQFDLSDDTAGTAKDNDLIAINGNINFEDGIIISITPLNKELTVGAYKLIQYSGAFTGNLDQITLENIPGVPYKLKNENGCITLKILKNRDPTKISWVGGQNDNTWNLTITDNWEREGKPELFFELDTAYFDNNGGTNTTVNLVGNIPASQVFINSTLNYTFQGEGSISGNAGITKQGSGKLTIKNTNQYTGSSILEGGTIVIPYLNNVGSAGFLGATGSTGDNIVFNGGELSITSSSSSSDRNIRIAEGGGTVQVLSPNELSLNGTVSGTGALTKSGYGKLIINSANTLSGGIILEMGDLIMGNKNAMMYGAGDGSITILSGTLSMVEDESIELAAYFDVVVPKLRTADIDLNGYCKYTGSLTGEGTINLNIPGEKSMLMGDWSGFKGTIIVTTDENGGRLLLGNESGYAGTSFRLSDNMSVFYTSDIEKDGIIEIGELTGSANTVLGTGGTKAITRTWKLGGKNTSFTFDGRINEQQLNSTTVGSTAIVKTGGGTLTLTNSNTYSAGTIVEQGQLQVENTEGSATGTGSVQIRKNASLAGNGYIVGPVILEGYISPGNQGIGQLSIANDLVFMEGAFYNIDLNTDTDESDLLDIQQSATLGGILSLTNYGTEEYKLGDQFKIFNISGSCSGNYTSIYPKTPGTGLKWDKTSLCTDGKLKVADINDDLPSVLNNSRKVHLTIFPNPSNGVFNLKLIGFENKAFQITIEGMDGSHIYQDIINSGTDQIRLNLAGIEKGIYIIKMQSNKSLISKKIIIN